MKFIDDYQEPYDAEHLKPIIPLNEQVDKATVAFNNLRKTIEEKLLPTIRALVDYMCPIIKTVNEVVTRTYPNRRVVYLATHGKEKTRKKNIKRILKWVEKGCKQ